MPDVKEASNPRFVVLLFAVNAGWFAVGNKVIAFTNCSRRYMDQMQIEIARCDDKGNAS
jgi:hypothetical protein